MNHHISRHLVVHVAMVDVSETVKSVRIWSENKILVNFPKINNLLGEFYVQDKNTTNKMHSLYSQNVQFCHIHTSSVCSFFIFYFSTNNFLGIEICVCSYFTMI